MDLCFKSEGGSKRTSYYEVKMIVCTLFCGDVHLNLDCKYPYILPVLMQNASV